MNNRGAAEFGGYCPADIGEGERTGSPVRMESLRGCVPIQRVNPAESHRQTTEIEMVFNSIFISALAVKCADLMLEFFEAAFDFPACGVVLDHLLGRRGPFLSKAHGQYHLVAADYLARLGVNVDDSLVATSDTLFGPYSKRTIFVLHSGQTTVFKDSEGKYHATFCGNDRFAAFRDRAGIVPLEWMKGWFRWQFCAPGGVLRTHPNKVYTERGPWHKLLPLFTKPGFAIRDHHIMQSPRDGYFYLSGSVYGEPYVGKMPIYRSRDLKEWEQIVLRAYEDEEELAPEAKKNGIVLTADGKPNLKSFDNFYMSTSVNWVPKLKNYAINYELLVKPKGTNGILLSSTGRGEGPYKRVARGFNCGKFFQDDDGRFYMTAGCNALRELNDDFTIKEKLPDVVPASGGMTSEDCECALLKMRGKYVFFTITCATSTLRWLPQSAQDYGFSYMTADSPKGPWSKLMPGPAHCAWGVPFRGLDGHWYASTFAEDLLGSFHCLPSIVRLKVDLKDGQLLIDIDEDWTPADYVPVTEWNGEGEFSPYTDTAPGPKRK